ncbi:MAG: baseplate J/gp47 family protein, partial [Bryobacteraceae bacterium]
ANFKDVCERLSITNPLPATGGQAAETLDAAIARAIRMLARPQRAITLSDYETLTLETPGADVARVTAWADHHPSFPCFEAQGVVTVVVLPNMPGPTAPMPSPNLIRGVAAYLNRRRIAGTRIEVTGPAYRTVTVQARIQSTAGANKTAVQQRIVDALNAFLDPLTGGPAGTGWPFGRAVFRTEMLQTIDQVPGVDYVTSLALFVDGCLCDPQCGNVCLSPTELVAAGAHQIEVL